MRRSLLALTSLIAPAAWAGDCINPNACYHAQMPLYNQNDASIGRYWLPNGPDNSQLCGPTSGSMALQAVYGELWSADRALVKGWARSSFVGRAPQQQIAAMASKMGTDPGSGSYFIPWDPPVLNIGMNAAIPHIATRDGEFPVSYGSGGSVSGWGPTVSVKRYVQRLSADHKSADVLIQGHYTKTKTSILGVDTYYYSRNGGHILAVKGFENAVVANKTVQTVVINDPWYAQRQNYVINQLYAGVVWDTWYGIPYISSVTVVPNVGFQSSYLYSSGNYYAIVDGELGLWASIAKGLEPSLINRVGIATSLSSSLLSISASAPSVQVAPISAVSAGSVIRR